MKREIRFIDREKQLCKIEIEYRDVLSICGDAGTCYGQVLHHIKPATKAQEDLLHFWELYHLKGSYPADELNGIILAIEAEQEERYQDACRKYSGVRIYDRRANEYIENIATIFERSGWGYIDYDDTRRVLALLRAVAGDIDDIDGINIIDGETIELWGVPYYVCTEAHAEDACRDFFERDMWVDAVTAGNTDLGYYEWCDYVIKTDGCGMLNSYDGKVSIEQVDGAEYYVIRQQ